MIYAYQHPETGEVIEVSQGMNEKHVYFDNSGTEWKRIFLPSQISMNKSSVNPFSSSDYVQKTREMKGSYGDLLDMSREASEKRAEKHGGEDPVKRKYFDEYSKKRRGKKHPEDKKVIENNFAKVEL